MKSVLKKAAAAFAALVMTAGLLAGARPLTAYAGAAPVGSNADYAIGDRDNIIQPDCSLVLIYGPDNLKVEAGGTYQITQRFLLTEGTRNYTDPAFIGKSEDRMVEISKIEVKPYNQSSISTEVRFRYNMPVEVTYTITVSSLAKVGKLEFGITAYDSRPITYDEDKNAKYANTGAFKISLDVLTACSEPQFVLLDDPRVTATAGEYVSIPVHMINLGEMAAFDIYVSLGTNPAFVSASTLLKQKIPSKACGEDFIALFTFLVDADAESARFSLPITVTCRDYSGVSYTDSTYSIIVDLQGKEEFSRASSYVVKNVTQSPEKPHAGENVTVTFDLENNGDSDFRNVKVLLGGYSSSSFEPIDSNPYTIIGDLNAREVKKISLTYKCGNNIGAGTHGLNLNFVGENKKGGKIEGDTTVFVLNVVPGKSGGDGNSVSKPKLMVTDFGADKPEILAADKFDFKFKIKNTNNESVARNIKVKVTSQSFSVTAGSNTFFISEIFPGEEAEIVINLKASSALQTGAYAINVSMEYEYDAEVRNGESDNSVTANDEILLQVSELLRAQCENITVGDWETPVMGMNTPLSFEFYNMGRSSLSNVYVTVEGDFELATGNSHYVGNVGPGSPEFVECTVRPLTSGEAELKLIIHMEDSNGDEVTRETYQTVYVSDGSNGGGMGGDIIDLPDFPGGDIDPGIADGEKKSVNKALVGGIIAGVVVVAAVVVIVIVVKKKKKNVNDDEFDD